MAVAASAILFAVPALAGCTDVEFRADNGVRGAPAGASAAADVGSAAYRATIRLEATRVRPRAECPALTVVQQGAGESTHLGSITVLQHHCMDPRGPDPTRMRDGYFEHAAANGDRLFGLYAGRRTAVGSEPVDRFVVEGSWRVTGGTGRFHGASGAGSIAGTSAPRDGGGSIAFEGWLRYPDMDPEPR